MSRPNSFYQDGLCRPDIETTVIPRVKYPFATAVLPDRFSRIYERDYNVLPTLYTPKIATRTSWTNLLTWSEDFTNAAWTKTNLTPTLSTGTAPDGNITLDQLLETVTNAAHSATQAATVAAASNFVGVFAQAGLGRNWIKVTFTDSAATAFSCFFDISSGNLGTKSAGVTPSITPMGSSQYLVGFFFTPAAGAGTFKVNVSTDGTTTSYAGDITKGVYLWGAAIVAASTVPPYIKTTSATRTISSPNVDSTESAGGDPFAFLVMEDDPVNITSLVAQITRKLARIPLTQVVPTSIQLAKPAVSGSFPQAFGAYRLFQPDTTLLQYDAYFAQVVTADGGVPGFYPTGGTYTVSFGGQTTSAVAYNASAATLQTALNDAGMTAIVARGGVTVSGTYNSAGGFVITFVDYAQITLDKTSLTAASTINKTESLLNGGYTQRVAAFVPGVNQGYPNTNYDTSSLVATATISTGGNTTLPLTSWVATCYPDPGTFTGGTFVIKINGVSSSALAYNCSLATLQNALDVMSAGAYTAVSMYSYSAGGKNYAWTDASVLATNNSAVGFQINFNNTAVTGGTYTLTAFTQTTGAIAYNATAATMSAALNAGGMTGVAARGGATVTGDLTNGFTITFSNATITTGSASLSPVGSLAIPANIDGGIGKIDRLTFSNPGATRDLYIANHGIQVGDTIYIRGSAGPAYYSGITNFSIPDANTIRLNVTPALAWEAVVTIDEAGKRTKTGYTSGTASVRASNVTDFYLSGVSPGINSAADIVIPAQQSDSTALLLAIFAGQGTISYAVGQLTAWMTTPILAVTVTNIDSADVV